MSYGKHVALVIEDDRLTTGSTISALSRRKRRHRRP